MEPLKHQDTRVRAISLDVFLRFLTTARQNYYYKHEQVRLVYSVSLTVGLNSFSLLILCKKQTYHKIVQ